MKMERKIKRERGGLSACLVMAESEESEGSEAAAAAEDIETLKRDPGMIFFSRCERHKGFFFPILQALFSFSG